MQIYVDGDACPKVVKEILFRAANRRKIPVTLVANRGMYIPRSPFIKVLQVEQGMDVADEKIVEMVEAGDLVITADIPLANRVVEKKAYALNPRGELYTTDNVRHHLSIRDAMTELRESGIETGGPAAFSAKDRQAFANALDAFLAKQ